MADVTVASIDEMEPIYEGLARRARATLGVTGWGMQVMTLPPNWDGYPNHRHDADVEDANQEEALERLHGAACYHDRPQSGSALSARGSCSPEPIRAPSPPAPPRRGRRSGRSRGAG